MSEFLFIHPYGNPMERVVSAGAVGNINASGVEFLGLYSHEATENHIKGCKLAALDFQWFHSMPGLIAACKDIKRINPRVKIIVGGISAGLLNRFLFANAPIDYILIGSAENAFKTLVSDIARSRPYEAIPGVMTRDTAGLALAEPSQPPALDLLDTATIDWFPTLYEYTLAKHEYVASNNHMYYDNEFPFVAVNRGCLKSCSFCYGTYGEIFYPCMSDIRSAESIRSAIGNIERNPEYCFVNFIGDFITSVDYETVRRSLPSKSRLFCSSYFCKIPEPEKFALLLSTFKFTSATFVLLEEDYRPGTKIMKENMSMLHELLENLEATDQCSIAFDTLSARNKLALVNLVNRYPGLVFINDSREWLIKRPDSKIVLDDRGNKRAKYFFASSLRYQDVYMARKIMGSGPKTHFFKDYFAVERPRYQYFPRKSWDLFALSACENIVGVEQGKSALIPPSCITRKGEPLAFTHEFDINSSYLTAELPDERLIGNELFTIDYCPATSEKDPYRGRIKTQPVFRLKKPIFSNEGGRCVFLMRPTENGVHIKVTHCGELLFDAFLDTLFTISRIGVVIKPSPFKKAEIWESDLPAGKKLKSILCLGAPLDSFDEIEKRISIYRDIGVRTILLSFNDSSLPKHFLETISSIKNKEMDFGLVADVGLLRDKETASLYIDNRPVCTRLRFNGRGTLRNSNTIANSFESLSDALENANGNLGELTIDISINEITKPYINDVFALLTESGLPTRLVFFPEEPGQQNLAIAGMNALNPSDSVKEISIIAREANWDESLRNVRMFFSGFPPCAMQLSADMYDRFKRDYVDDHIVYEFPADLTAPVVCKVESGFFTSNCLRCPAQPQCCGIPIVYLNTEHSINEFLPLHSDKT